MSTTRIIFIIVCAVVAVLVFTLGLIIQRNNPDNKYSVAYALNPKAPGKRKRKFKLLKNPSSYLTIFLIIVLLFLLIVFKGF